MKPLWEAGETGRDGEETIPLHLAKGKGTAHKLVFHCLEHNITPSRLWNEPAAVHLQLSSLQVTVDISYRKNIGRKEKDESKNKGESHKRRNNDREKVGRNCWYGDNNWINGKFLFSFLAYFISENLLFELPYWLFSWEAAQSPFLPTSRFQTRTFHGKQQVSWGCLVVFFHTSWKTADISCQDLTLFNTSWCSGRSQSSGLKWSLVGTGQLRLHPWCVQCSKQRAPSPVLCSFPSPSLREHHIFLKWKIPARER